MSISEGLKSHKCIHRSSGRQHLNQPVFAKLHTSGNFTIGCTICWSYDDFLSNRSKDGQIYGNSATNRSGQINTGLNAEGHLWFMLYNKVRNMESFAVKNIACIVHISIFLQITSELENNNKANQATNYYRLNIPYMECLGPKVEYLHIHVVIFGMGPQSKQENIYVSHTHSLILYIFICASKPSKKKKRCHCLSHPCEQSVIMWHHHHPWLWISMLSVSNHFLTLIPLPTHKYLTVKKKWISQLKGAGIVFLLLITSPLADHRVCVHVCGSL